MRKRLTAEQAEQVRTYHRASGLSVRSIAERFSISKETARAIINGKWRPPSTRVHHPTRRDGFLSGGLLWRGGVQARFCRACGHGQTIWSDETEPRCFACWQRAGCPSTEAKSNGAQEEKTAAATT